MTTRRARSPIALRIVLATAAVLGGGACVARAGGAKSPAVGGMFAPAIDVARDRVVKLYGGSIGREHGFASGVVVSADGQIVTTLSVLLEGSSLRVVLPDGRKLPAEVVRRDDRRQLALLKVDARELPFFELSSSRELQIGDWVVAAANPFKVADGPEPVSFAVGVLAARTTLDARRRAQEFPYDGEVLLTDVVVSTPGCAGGALVDGRGRLVGVIGKAVIGNRTNTWLNYALPAEEIAAFVQGTDAAATGVGVPPEPAAGASPPTPHAAGAERVDLGIQLFAVGGRTKPAYVERVRPRSAARTAGLRANDLIVSVNGVLVATCEDFDAAARKLRVGDAVELSVKRGDEIVTIQFTAAGRGP
ncbi:MAG: S1C family serine protease [Phycisphaerae bacterium]